MKAPVLLLLLFITKLGFGQDAINEADQFYKAGNYEKAIPLYKQTISVLNARQLYCYARSIELFTHNLDDDFFSAMTKAATQGIDSAQMVLGGYRVLQKDPKRQEEGINWLERAAFQGLTDAHIKLGNYYVEVKGDHTKAESWYRKATLTDAPEAYLALGRYYYSNKQKKASVPFFLKATESKNAEAALYLAEFYSEDEPDSVKAVFYNKQYIQNSTTLPEYNSGYVNLGTLYMEGKAVKQDTTVGIYYFNQAIAKKYNKFSASIKLSDYYRKGLILKRNVNQAIKYAEISCEDTPSSFTCKIPIYLATYFFNNEEYEPAITLYKKHVAALDSNELNLFGMCYWYQKKYADALPLIKQAATKGNNVAMFNMGYSNYTAKGVDTNYTEAIKWFNVAAQNNYADAYTYLGRCFVLGKGVQKDLYKATAYFQKATDMGSHEGEHELAHFYENGSGGLKKDFAKALALYQKACEANISGTCDDVKNLKKRIEAEKNSADF